MTAEDLGARLLREVKEESLDELLHSLRIQASPSSTRLNFPPFNDFLRYQYPAPPPAPPQQHFRFSSLELTGDPSWPLPNPSPTPPPIIHLTSTHSSSGKTQLLYYVLAITILPRTYHTSSESVKLPGLNSLAIVFDTDIRFSAIRLQQILRCILSQQTKRLQPPQTLNEEDIDGIISRSLPLIHIFRPHSTAQVLATLNTLEGYLLDLQPPSSLHPLGALVLDSAGSFFWSDRLAQDLSRLPPDAVQVPTNQSPNLTSQILLSLRNIQSTFSCPIIYTTKQGLNPFPVSFATLTLKLEKVPVPKFPPFMSVGEAQGRERELRWQEVVRGRFAATKIEKLTRVAVGSVPGSERMPRWLGFRVTSDGVEIEEYDTGGG